MTDTLKAGDTVYGIKYTWIKNFDDAYYDIPIPTSVYKTTVTYYNEEVATWDRNRIHVTIHLANGITIFNKKIELYESKEEALEALNKERKKFVKDFPNNWKKIIKVLNELLKE